MFFYLRTYKFDKRTFIPSKMVEMEKVAGDDLAVTEKSAVNMRR